MTDTPKSAPVPEKTCPMCGGSQFVRTNLPPTGFEDCPTCHGTGRVSAAPLAAPDVVAGFVSLKELAEDMFDTIRRGITIEKIVAMDKPVEAARPVAGDAVDHEWVKAERVRLAAKIKEDRGIEPPAGAAGTGTPRTDAAAYQYYDTEKHELIFVVDADFARQLETDLAAAKEQAQANYDEMADTQNKLSACEQERDQAVARCNDLEEENDELSKPWDAFIEENKMAIQYREACEFIGKQHERDQVLKDQLALAKAELAKLKGPRA